MTLEAKNGSRIDAKLVALDGTKLEIIRSSDRKKFTLPLSRLSDETAAKVREWQEAGGGRSEDFDIDVETGKNRRTTEMEDFDDKRVNLDPVITVRNPHMSLSTCEAKVTALFMGRPVNNSSLMHVFRAQSFDLPEMAPGTSTTFDVKPISAAYDNRGYAKFGSRYTGYVVIIHDAGKRTVFAKKSVPSALAKDNALLFLDLQGGTTYNRALREVDSR